MKGAVIAVTPRGRLLALQIANAAGFTAFLPEMLFEAGDGAVSFTSLKEILTACFREQQAMVLVMACGIAVRHLAPLLVSKQTDPAVVVMDEGGQFAISLLSGHWGGANALAGQLAAWTGACPVITTATDVAGLYAVDVLARDMGAVPEPFSRVKALNAAMLRGETVAVFTERIHPESGRGLVFYRLSDLNGPGAGLLYRALHTNRAALHGAREDDLYLRPQNLYVGVGCRRGIPAAEILKAVRDVLARHNLAEGSLAALASIDAKRDEAGLTEAAEALQVPVLFFTKEEILALSAPYNTSEFVRNNMGVGAVCEPTAMLAARSGRLAVTKQTMGGITVAVAEGS